MKHTTMKKIYEVYKADHDATYKHGNCEYSIAHNATCTIHTWIIRKKRNEKNWEWYCPLPTDIR